MKIIRYQADGVRYGEQRGEMVHPLSGDLFALSPTDEAPFPLASVKLLAPVTPGKIVAIGPGYLAHLGGNPPPARPYYWIKPATALLDPGGTIELPGNVPMVCHESELAIVIGRTARKVSQAEAAGCIFGHTCINDVSAGELTNMAAYMQSQFFVDGKMFDTFAPLGPAIVTDIDASDLRIQCRVNGQSRQDHRSSDRIWSSAALVALVSQTLTLQPGDVIATGSPPGPAPLVDGDTVEVEIEGIGILRNEVRQG